MYYTTGEGPMISEPLMGLGQDDSFTESPVVRVFWGIASIAGGIGGIYHGYKRTRSAGWALAWGFFGSILPVIAMPLAYAQGFAKPKGS